MRKNEETFGFTIRTSNDSNIEKFDLLLWKDESIESFEPTVALQFRHINSSQIIFLPLSRLSIESTLFTTLVKFDALHFQLRNR